MPYCQLGTTVFDGAKSFVTFSSDEGAVLVEHALINRKPRLQAMGLSLRTISLSILLDQRYCVVKTEMTNLRSAKDSFTVLPLLWGNGTLEGNFVISTLNFTNVFNDNLGNIITCACAVTLAESVNDDALDQQQQQAITNGFANGNKAPATKSTRTNAVSCNKVMANSYQYINSFAAQVNTYMSAYSLGNPNNAKTLACLNNINLMASFIDGCTTDPAYPCVNGNAAAAAACNHITFFATDMGGAINRGEFSGIANPTGIATDNAGLQQAVANLRAALSSNISQSILNK